MTAQPAHTVNPDELEVAEGREREQLEGWIPSLASDEEIILAQQIVHFINTTGLRIFYRHQPSFNFARGNCPENIGKTPAGNRLSLRTKICSDSFVAECSTFALKRYADSLLCRCYILPLLIN